MTAMTFELWTEMISIFIGIAYNLFRKWIGSIDDTCNHFKFMYFLTILHFKRALFRTIRKTRKL